MLQIEPTGRAECKRGHYRVARTVVIERLEERPAQA
jgi:hypothetical protein